MDRSEPIKLIKVTYQKDEYGVSRKVETVREVFAQVDSASQSEFYQGGQAGLKPELRFTMFRFDYGKETIVEYENERYSIYRTYRAKNDNIELYVQKEAGRQ